MDAQVSWVDEIIEDVLAYLNRASDLLERLVLVDQRSHNLTIRTREHIERAGESIRVFTRTLIRDLESIHREGGDGPLVDPTQSPDNPA
jgi:hypothetical protein